MNRLSCVTLTIVVVLGTFVSAQHKVILPNFEKESITSNTNLTFVSKAYFYSINSSEAFINDSNHYKNYGDSIFSIVTSEGERDFLNYAFYADLYRRGTQYSYNRYNPSIQSYILHECWVGEYTFCNLLIIDSVTNKSFLLESGFSDFGFGYPNVSPNGNYIATYLNDGFTESSYLFICKVLRAKDTFDINKSKLISFYPDDLENALYNYEELISEENDQENKALISENIKVLETLINDIDSYLIKELRWINTNSLVIELEVDFKHKNKRTIYLKSIID